jgi:hypothetical protein
MNEEQYVEGNQKVTEFTVSPGLGGAEGPFDNHSLSSAPFVLKTFHLDKHTFLDLSLYVTFYVNKASFC